MTGYGELIGNAVPMRFLFDELSRIERTLLSVLIQGESGTGKELVARAIHGHSRVANGPLVSINCGAIQRELVASELFGHRRGAFTGAVESRVGAFEAAHGGTLFLDEIGELPLDLQPLLLRALEEGVVTRVGETQPRGVRVRVIAATHVDLEERVRCGAFRADLYYRLMVLPVQVPPLRQRREDIVSLAGVFVRRAGASALPHEVLQKLNEHDWPGNVRELRHAVECYSVLGRLPRASGLPRADVHACLEQFCDLSQPYHELKGALLSAFSEAYLSRLFERTAGNVSRAARLSGLDRSYLNKLARRSSSGESPSSASLRTRG